MMKLNNHLALIGMMGTGKTTVGQALATALDMPFFDSDRVLEAETGQKIPDIFKNQGEATFRALESATILRLLENKTPSIIATGGGSVTSPVVADALFGKTCLTMCMTAPVDVLMDRMGNTTRPLLAGDDPRGVLIKKLSERAPLYARAHITLDTSSKPLPELIHHIVHLLSLYQTGIKSS